MGIMVSKNLEQKSELSRRITSDLQARAQNTDQFQESVSGMSESETRSTSKFSWVWLILIILAVISLVCILFI